MIPNTTPISAEKPAAPSIASTGTRAGGNPGIIAAMPAPMA